MKKQLLDSAYKMASAIEMINASNNTDKLKEVFVGLGYTNERLLEIVMFINEKLTEEEVGVFIEKQTFFSYIEGLQEFEKLMDIAKGYEEMGEVNLEIADEYHHSQDEEGEKLHELGTETIEGDSQAG